MLLFVNYIKKKTSKLTEKHGMSTQNILLLNTLYYYSLYKYNIYQTFRVNLFDNDKIRVSKLKNKSMKIPSSHSY